MSERGWSCRERERGCRQGEGRDLGGEKEVVLGKRRGRERKGGRAACVRGRHRERFSCGVRWDGNV